MIREVLHIVCSASRLELIAWAVRVHRANFVVVGAQVTYLAARVSGSEVFENVSILVASL